MKKLMYLFSVLLVLQIAFFACNEEEFLTPEFKNKIVDINFLTNPEHAGPAVVAIYDVLGFQGLFTWDRMILGSSSSDETVEDHGDPEWADLINIDKYLWTPENNHIWEHWEANYTGIARANLVIAKVPQLQGLNATLAARYVAEAKALRALFYYNLVTAHGDVPLTLEPLSFDQAKNLTRTPELEIWDQIISDLKDARDGLPDTYPESDLGRATKGFANAMLSRVYLWTKEYDKAEAAALAVINSPANYDLEPVYADLFNGVSNNSVESILDVMCAPGANEQNMWARQRDETNRNYLYGPYFSWSWFLQPARNFVDAVYLTEDIRVDTMTLDSKAPASETYDINNDGIADDEIPPSPPGLLHLMKYVPAHTDLTDGIVWSGGLGWVHVHIVRYSEVLLNYAEALVEQNKSSEALPHINKVRNRGGESNITTTDKAVLLNTILYERKLEFCFEGMRFFDLKRAGKLQEVLGPLGWTAKNEVFPIPQKEIDLTLMEQNTGY